MQNIHFYGLLTLYKQIKKPEIKEFKVKTEKFIENDYDNYVSPEISVKAYETDGQLQYNITNN